MDDSFCIEMIEDDDFVLKLSGDLSTWSAQRFWNQMKDMLDNIESEEKPVFVDFADLTYIHSSGIGALLQLLEYCRNNNIPIRFRNIQGSVERIFTLANVIDLFPLQEQPPTTYFSVIADTQLLNDWPGIRFSSASAG